MSIQDEGLKPEEVKPKEEKVEKVEKIEKLEKPDKITELSEGLKKANKTIELLLSVADKKALSLYHQRNPQELPSVISLRSIDGKIVVGWRTSVDKMYKDAALNRWIENQKVELLFEDDSAEEMSLSDWNLRYILVPCNKKGTVVDDKTKQLSYKLERQDNGKEYIVDSQFVN